MKANVCSTVCIELVINDSVGSPHETVKKKKKTLFFFIFLLWADSLLKPNLSQLNITSEQSMKTFEFITLTLLVSVLKRMKVHKKSLVFFFF